MSRDLFLALFGFVLGFVAGVMLVVVVKGIPCEQAAGREFARCVRSAEENNASMCRDVYDMHMVRCTTNPR